jgi:hypothetical protein
VPFRASVDGSVGLGPDGHQHSGKWLPYPGHRKPQRTSGHLDSRVRNLKVGLSRGPRWKAWPAIHA